MAEARNAHVLERRSAERGRLSELDQEVAERMHQRESVVLAAERANGVASALDARVADSMARWGGSWPFVLGFVGLLVVWTLVNGLVLRNRNWDPYPFILLNLVLSCLAALQAPIVLMSQNRSEGRDRKRAESDYRVNLKAEIEVAALHDMLDHVLHTHYEEMIELPGGRARPSRAAARPALDSADKS